MALLKPIGDILAEPEFRLTEPPRTRPRKPHGVERKRFSRIRQSSKLSPWFETATRKKRNRSMGARISRRAWRAAHPKNWIEIALIGHLLTLPAETTFNQSQFATTLKNRHGPVHVVTIQKMIAGLERFHCLTRTEQHGGRGRGIKLELNHIALAGRARNLENKTIVSPPITPSCRNSASSGSANEQPQAQKTKPLNLIELHDYMRRAINSRDSARRMRGGLGAIRNAARYRGCKLHHSCLITRVTAELAGAVGKQGHREAFIRSVLVRILKDSVPGNSYALVRRFVSGAPEWTAQWQEQRRIASLDNSAERGKEICPAEPPGRVFGADSVPSYPEKNRVSSTAPVVCDEPVSSARASQLFTEILNSLPKGATNGRTDRTR